VRQELWFHVEHTPVQPAATLGRTFFDQSVDIRVDDFDEQG
jgi:hypothetical protein